MAYEGYSSIENLECNLCNKPAKMIWTSYTFLGSRIRFFCKECAKKHAIVRRDR